MSHKIYHEWFDNHFQESYSPVLDGIMNLHHDILVYLTTIMISLLYLLIRLLWLNIYKNDAIVDSQFIIKKKCISISNSNKYLNTEIISELIWTVLPLLILIFIGILTMSFLYNLDNYLYFPTTTISTTGHQWYWSYDYNDFNINLDSYMIPSEYLSNGELRLLEVDNRLLLPAQTHVRMFVTSDDVIHSWSVPSLGVKMDASPGRMNHCHLFINKIGIFYGQCSELCGIGHAFMPIVIQAMPIQFFNYLFNNHIL